MSGYTIGNIDSEMLTPVLAHFGLVIGLDGKNNRSNVIGNIIHKIVVFWCVDVIGRQELDDRAQCALGTKNGARRITDIFLVGRQHTLAVVVLDNFLHQVHVLVVVSNEDWSVNCKT